MWVFTVVSATKSRSAISVFDSPSAMSARTSASRSVSPSGRGPAREAAGCGTPCSLPCSLPVLGRPQERGLDPRVEDGLAGDGGIEGAPDVVAVRASLVRYPDAPAERAARMDSSSA